jgi:hypothetical protein
MAIKPVNTENLTVLQELYRKFWTKFNDISSSNEDFKKEFKVHKIPSIRYYQDYSVGRCYQICIKINFKQELVAIQAYFSNMSVFSDFVSKHKDRIELMIGRRLIWEEKTTKGYAQFNLNISSSINNIANWDDICNEIIPNAISMKRIFELF